MWKDILNYEDCFSVSDDGQIFSKRTNKILKLQDLNGYWVHCTRVQGKVILFRVHREVAKAFIPNLENKPQVNHKDGCKKNNSVKNLEWVTAKENTEHAWANGLAKAKRGVNKENSKLTVENVDFIKSNHKKNGGEFTTRELGFLLGLHHTNISRVLRGVSYRM